MLITFECIIKLRGNITHKSFPFNLFYKIYIFPSTFETPLFFPLREKGGMHFVSIMCGHLFICIKFQNITRKNKFNWNSYILNLGFRSDKIELVNFICIIFTFYILFCIHTLCMSELQDSNMLNQTFYICLIFMVFDIRWTFYQI